VVADTRRLGIDAIVAVGAEQVVGAEAAVDDVITRPAIDPLTGGTAGDGVVAIATVDAVEQRAVNLVFRQSQNDDVVAAAGVNEVALARDLDAIVARAAVEGAFGRDEADQVVALIAGDG